MPAKARPAARAALLVCLGAALATLSGCGDEADPPRARVSVLGPADDALVHEDQVEVRGRVRPLGAHVLVAGEPATVDGGSFRALVPLEEGANVIDVGATARGATPVWTAVRVSRQSLVTVPDLAGADSEDAVDELTGMGLRSSVDKQEGFFDRLLPGGWRVCESSPSAGAEVPRGETVRLSVSKTC
jgi:hypothetical protein